METSTADVTAPIKPTSQTSSFRLLVVGGIGALLLPFLVPIACNLCVRWGAFLPEDAVSAKAFFWSTGATIVALITGGGMTGTVVGSLGSKFGKVFAQLFPGIATAATPNGEGIGGSLQASPAPDMGIPTSDDEVMASHVPTNEDDNDPGTIQDEEADQ